MLAAPLALLCSCGFFHKGCWPERSGSFSRKISQALFKAQPLLPCLQAAWHGKPIVGMPLMIEQPDNLARAEEQVCWLDCSSLPYQLHGQSDF